MLNSSAARFRSALSQVASFGTSRRSRRRGKGHAFEKARIEMYYSRLKIRRLSNMARPFVKIHSESKVRRFLIGLAGTTPNDWIVEEFH